MKTNLKRAPVRLDLFAMALSSVCLLHCLVTPLILMSLPIMGRYYVTHPFVHIFLAAVIIPVTIYSFRNVVVSLKLVSILMLFMSTLGALLVSVVPILVHVFKINLPEIFLLIFGSTLLLTAHILKISQQSSRRGGG